MPPHTPNPKREWLAFSATALFWGTSFFWIKMCLQEITPWMTISLRITVAAVALVIFWIGSRRPMPPLKKIGGRLMIAAFFSPFIPFLLITWGETRIDSGLASLLNGTVPLFTIWVAHAALADDSITMPKLIGLLTGFFGMVVLFGGGNGNALSLHSFLGQVAVVVAAISYAVGSVFVRRELRGVSPLLITTATMCIAAVYAWGGTLLTSGVPTLPIRPLTWVALLWMGILGTAVAFHLYYYVLDAWGATRSSLVNYAYPVVGLILGSVFLKEPLTLRIVLGAALIFCGVAVAQKPQARSKSQASTGTGGQINIAAPKRYSR